MNETGHSNQYDNLSQLRQLAVAHLRNRILLCIGKIPYEQFAIKRRASCTEQEAEKLAIILVNKF